MGGLSRFAPKPDFQPAGYLPAPQQARFISEAEQAAEKLPATIKSQSLKNALLKGGAKPLELEYAGIDDFISQNQGKPVSAADVLAHLRTEGPLGKLKRVEQQVPETADSHLMPVPPAYAENVRAPFDPSFASSETRYSRYTVPGQKGDFTGYREVLLEDPKNSKGTGNRMLVEPPTREAHRQINQTEMEDILRRHNVPNYEAIDWDQVDEPGYINHGDATRLLELNDELNGGWPQGGTGEYIPQDPVDAHRADYWTRYNEYPDRIAVQNIQSDIGQDYSKNGKVPELDEAGFLSAVERARELDQKSQRWGLDNEEMQELRRLDQAIAEHEHKLPVSPLAKDGNWKNLMARHIALQSIHGMGKPITIPTGRQMVDVEGFGMGTHDNEIQAARAATDFNADLVRRLQKIFRGLHPDGAIVEEALRGGGPMVTSIHPSKARVEATAFKNGELRRLHELPDEVAYDGNDGPLVSGNSRIERAIKSGDVGALEKAVQTPARPEFRDAAMKVIQYNRLMEEMGQPGVSDTPNVSQKNDPAPGWTIKPSPMAVRQALEKGLPIMSLAPLLLSPQQEQQ